MGLWDLDPQLNRVKTELVDIYRGLIDGGCDSVGRLGLTEGERIMHVS